MPVVEDVCGADVGGAKRHPRVIGRELVQLDAENRGARALPGREESARTAGGIEHGYLGEAGRGNERLQDLEEQVGQPQRGEVLRVLGGAELPEPERVV